MNASLVVEPFITLVAESSVAVIVMVGEILSNVQLNAVVAVLLFPAVSVNLFAATLIVHAP